MNSRDRIAAACNHTQPDVVPVDFGGGSQTGIHVSMVYQLRQALGLDRPGTCVKVVEVYQMLGEIAPDLAAALGVDTVSLAGPGTMFGFPFRDFKEWEMPDGTPIIVPGGFNTEWAADGYLYLYPEDDRTVPPSGRMPTGGNFFDAIVRQEPFDDETLDPEANLEEFKPISDSDLDHYRTKAERLHATGRALFCSFRGLTFGDIALVPAVSLKHPRGIRDLEEWYISTVTRRDYIKAVFERQSEIALENLKRLHAAVGDAVTVICTNGTDFGTQTGPFLSEASYRDLYLPYQKKLHDWIHGNTTWKIFMHCCGGVGPLIPAIIDAGFDILNPVQCSATGMDARTLKDKYGKDLVFWGGGVDTQRTLPFGTPDDVKAQVRERIEIFSPGGGFVFCSVHNIQAKTPIKNLLAMFEAIKSYR